MTAPTTDPGPPFENATNQSYGAPVPIHLRTSPPRHKPPEHAAITGDRPSSIRAPGFDGPYAAFASNNLGLVAVLHLQYSNANWCGMRFPGLRPLGRRLYAMRQPAQHAAFRAVLRLLCAGPPSTLAAFQWPGPGYIVSGISHIPTLQKRPPRFRSGHLFHPPRGRSPERLLRNV